MSGKTIRLELVADVSKFVEALRSAATAFRSMAAASRAAGRSMRQAQRNAATGPLSDERREIQAIGHREMAGAIEWFREHTNPYRATRTAPTEGDQS